MPKDGRPSKVVLPGGGIVTNPVSPQRLERLARDMALFDAYRKRQNPVEMSVSMMTYDKWARAYNAQLPAGTRRVFSGSTQSIDCGGWSMARANMAVYLSSLQMTSKQAMPKPFSVVLQKIGLPRHQMY